MLKITKFAIRKNLQIRLQHNFCSISQKILQSTLKLRNSVEQQIKSEQKIYDDEKKQIDKLQAYFQKNNWLIQQNKTKLLELKKNIKSYSINVLFIAQTPLLITQNNKLQQQQQKPKVNDLNTEMQKDDEQQQDQFLKEVTVCIKKDGLDKCLVADYIISTKGSQLTNVQFFKDLDKVKKNKLQSKTDKLQSRQGPQLSSLQQKTQELVGQFIQNFGIDSQFLQNSTNYGVLYEQKFYIQWLKDIRSLT